MGETASNEKAPKKDSVVVIAATLVLGIAIALLDLIIKFGLNIVIG